MRYAICGPNQLDLGGIYSTLTMRQNSRFLEDEESHKKRLSLDGNCFFLFFFSFQLWEMERL